MDVASAKAAPRSASLATADAGASPPETLRRPRVSEKTAEWVGGAGARAAASSRKRSTGRVAESLRSAHFQSSLIKEPFSTGGAAS